MLRYLVFALILVHALIHLMGFMKGQNLANLEELHLPISKGVSWVWLMAALLLLSGGIGFLYDTSWWLGLLTAGTVLSQILIFLFWQDAKFGTLANVLLTIILVAGYGAQNFEQSFRQDVAQTFEKLPVSTQEDVLTIADITHLPRPVQQYLQYTGSLGRPKVRSFQAVMHGEMRQDEADKWFTFRAEQYNTIADPSRLFFMKARVKGLPTAGYHAYQNREALMLIKVLSLLPVVDIQEDQLFRAETVTFLNDVCIMAPAALIDERFQWEPLDDRRVRVIFENQGVSVSAELQFAADGRLINFRSNDRTDINRRAQVPFSTPIGDYQEVDGRLVPTYGEAIWHYPEGAFTYGRFHIDKIIYNEMP